MRLSFFLLLISVFCFSVRAQNAASAKNWQRGMYVDSFYRPGGGILGDSARENKLLRYARDNRMNYLLLYDTDIGVIGDSILEKQLSDFIVLAKNVYGIESIGCVGSFDEKLKLRPKPLFEFSAEQMLSPEYNSILKKVNDPPDADNLGNHVRSLIRYYLQLDYYNGKHQGKVDVFHLEFEFWASYKADGSFDKKECSKRYQYYLHTLQAMKGIKKMSKFPFLIETYLGYFDHDDIDDMDQAVDIDVNADRVLLHFYIPDFGNNAPPTDFLRSDYSIRLLTFATNNKKTEIFPIFSAENKGGNVFLGRWLKEPCNTLYRAESIFMEELADKGKKYYGDNHIGGFQWFTYHLMPPTPCAGCDDEQCNQLWRATPKLYAIKPETVYSGSIDVTCRLPLKFGKALINITDGFGKSKNSFTIVKPGITTLQVDVSSFAAGNYFVQLIMNGNVVSSRKVTVAKN